MLIHDIMIVPSVGYCTNLGYSRGHIHESIIEINVVDAYVRAIADELDDAGVRHQVMSVRKPPGILESERHNHVSPSDFVLHCSIGWGTKPPSKMPQENVSKVYFAKHEVNALARSISDALGHWGKVYACHGHRASNPIVDDHPLLKVGRGGIRIEPFVLNGHSAETYVLRLEQLGRDVGRCISNFVIQQNKGIRTNLAMPSPPAVRTFRIGSES